LTYVAAGLTLKMKGETMRSTLFGNYGGYKVWQRPLNKGRGSRFEVRLGNKVLAHHIYAHDAMKDASDRFDAWVDEQARYLKQMKAIPRIRTR
jgi:hypothetical protein